MKRILFSVVAATLIISAWGFAQTKSSATPAPKPASSTASSNPGKGMGSKNAPITVEVFSDFQCPACQNFFETTSKPLIDNYVNTGKVYLVHRDFPLPMHPFSTQVARFANAAADLGMFEAVERALFDKQMEWSPTGKFEDSVGTVISPAQVKKIHDYQAVHLAEINAAIESDKTLGLQKGVNQTPSVFVTAHGKTEALPGGGVSYPLMKQYLDYLLRQ